MKNAILIFLAFFLLACDQAVPSQTGPAIAIVTRENKPVPVILNGDSILTRFAPPEGFEREPAL